MATRVSARYRFAAFILSHGRADYVRTTRALRRSNYRGDWYIICDNEDGMLPRYRELYGDRVIVFDKATAAQRVDVGDNFALPRQAVVFARQESYRIAEQMGLDYFLLLDDDYSSFYWLSNHLGQTLRYQHLITDLDAVLEILLDFYVSVPALRILAIAQSGDFIRSPQCTLPQRPALWRKVMNFMICSPHRPVSFMGRVNEDVCVYVVHGMRGELFFTIPFLSLHQVPPQQRGGGLTPTYLRLGLVAKAQYTFIMAPSCVLLRQLPGIDHLRIHHRIHWGHAVPRILRPDVKHNAGHESRAGGGSDG